METNVLITTIPLSSLNELFSALSKAQAQMHVAIKNSDNPFFKSKYADFGEIVEASRPALTVNGLVVIQRIILLQDGTEALHSVLGHSSGQYIDSLMRIRPVKNDVQSMGSYITYLKRYAYAALVGVITEDDDGEKTMIRTEYHQESATNNSGSAGKVIDQTKVQSLRTLLNGMHNGSSLEKNILSFNRVSSLDSLYEDQYTRVLTYIRDNTSK